MSSSHLSDADLKKHAEAKQNTDLLTPISAAIVAEQKNSKTFSGQLAALGKRLSDIPASLSPEAYKSKILGVFGAEFVDAYVAGRHKSITTFGRSSLGDTYAKSLCNVVAKRLPADNIFREEKGSMSKEGKIDAEILYATGRGQDVGLMLDKLYDIISLHCLPHATASKNEPQRDKFVNCAKALSRMGPVAQERWNKLVDQRLGKEGGKCLHYNEANFSEEAKAKQYFQTLPTNDDYRKTMNVLNNPSNFNPQK